MKYLYLDIETNLAHDTIWCVCVVDSKGNVNTLFDTQKDRDWLQTFIDNNDYVAAHNGIGFDFPVLARLWGVSIPEEKQVDTLYLSRLENPQRAGGHSLRNWGGFFGDEKIDFDDYDGGLTDEMVKYCQQDAKLLKRVYEYLMDRTKKWKNFEKCSQLEYEVGRIIHKQYETGFKLDFPYATQLLGEMSARMTEIEIDLQEQFPPIVTERYSEKTGKRLKDNVEVFNVGSRRQIAKRLESLGADFTKLTEKGNYIVDETTLKAIDLPQAHLCAEYLMVQKRVGMIEGWLKHYNEDTGRVHGKVITNGAVTGRMTHHSPNLGQIVSVNSPYGKEMRKCWTVDKGNKLVGCDLSGIELRCLAHYMQDADWTKELLEGDIHTKNQKAAGLETRAQAKTFCYAVLYGAGAAKVGSIVGKGRDAGKKLMNNFLSNTPALKELKKKVERVAGNGFLPGLDGRALQVRSQHSALNTLLQSAGAIIAKQWIVEVDKEIKRRGLQDKAKQVVVVHDEIQVECNEDVAEEVAQITEEAAVKAGEVLGVRLPIEAESKVGDNWYMTH